MKPAQETPSAPSMYVLDEEIGSGAFSTVWRGHHLIHDFPVAIKVIKKSTLLNKDAAKRLQEELDNHKKMNHQFIAPVFSTPQNIANHYIIMEYIETGTLAKKLEKEGAISLEESAHFFVQLAYAIKYMHEVQNVCHHDLKLSNILIDSDSNVRVIDFGLSSKFVPGSPIQQKSCGSPKYAAPELFEGTEHDNLVDIWSAGVILFKLVCGYFPFDHSKITKLKDLVISTEPKYPDNLDPGLVQLLKGMLAKDPRARLTISQIFENSWFKDQLALEPPLPASYAGTSPKNREMKEKLAETNESSLARNRSSPALSITNRLISSGRFKPLNKDKPPSLFSPLRSGATQASFLLQGSPIKSPRADTQ